MDKDHLREDRAIGLDFYIDDAPQYVLTGTVSAWNGEHIFYDCERVSRDDLRSLFEDPPELARLTIDTAALEPELPDEVPETPHWAYGGFYRFRRRLAKVIGIDLDMMYGFGDEEVARRKYAEHVGLDLANHPGREAWSEDFLRRAVEWWNENHVKWEDVNTPLESFLHHSDCDGDLSPEQCAQVALALREALEKVTQEPYDRFGDGHDWDVEKGYQLAECMEFCAKYQRRLVFC